MGRGKLLINKIKRRNHYLKRNRGFRTQDKIDKNDERLADSQKAFKLMRGIERKLDARFGRDSVPSPTKIELEKLLIVNDFDRFDFDPGMGTDYGLRLSMDVVLSGEMEQTEITCLADTGEFEDVIFTLPSGVLANQADYLYFTDPAGETWAVWLDIDAAGTPPSGAHYLGADHQVMVSVLSTDTNIQLAGKVFVGLDGAITNMNAVDNGDGTINLTSILLGNLPDATTYLEDDSTSGSILASIATQGLDSNLQSTYLILHAPPSKQYHAWFNVNGEGVAPSVPNSIEIEVNLNGGESDADVATALSAAIDALDDFDASSSLEVVTVIDAINGEAIDAEDGNTGFSINVTQQGVNEFNPHSFQSIGIKAGDIILVLTGTRKGKEYEVVEVINNNTLRLEDDSALVLPEVDVPMKFRLSSIKKSYT